MEDVPWISKKDVQVAYNLLSPAGKEIYKESDLLGTNSNLSFI